MPTCPQCGALYKPLPTTLGGTPRGFPNPAPGHPAAVNTPTRTNRQMTNDDIAFLRLLADWHDRQARYLLLTIPAGQHDQGRFNSTAAARLSRLADEATMSVLKGKLS
jgi:hypothetical protein